MFSQRWLFGYGAIACAVLILTALYFEHVLGLDPCPLCIIQRGFVLALGLVMLAGAIHDPGRLGRRVYGALTTVLAGSGAIVAGRHVWLQSLPPERVPECGPGLAYLLESFPWRDALRIVFEGSGECAEVQWQLLGLTIPGWTLVAFGALALLGLYLALSRGPSAR